MLVRARLVFAFVTVLVLSGCGVRFFYSQLDWLVPWYLQDYVPLDDTQRALLDHRLARRLEWHCRSQLPAYGVALREVAETVSASRIDLATLEGHADRVETFLRELAAAVAPDAAALMATLSDEQVAALFTELATRNEAMREEYLDDDAAAMVVRQAERMEKRLRRWFGRLTAEQRALVTAWAEGTMPVAEQWFENRLAWQRRLAGALSVRDAGPAFEADVVALVTEADAHWTATYRAAVLKNRALTLRLLIELHAAAGPRQRARLGGELDSLARQFERAACADRAPAAHTATPAGSG